MCVCVCVCVYIYIASWVTQLVMNPATMQETPVRFLGLKDRPGEGIGYPLQYSWASLVAQMVKDLPAMRETGFDPWVGRSPGGGHGNPLQYSCLENPMDRGAWRAIAQSHKELDMTEQLTIHISKLNHCPIHLKLTQHCKLTILQFFKMVKKNT